MQKDLCQSTPRHIQISEDSFMKALFKCAVLIALPLSAFAMSSDQDLKNLRDRMKAGFGPKHEVLIPGQTYMGGNHTVVHCVASVSDSRLWNFSNASLVKGMTCGKDGKMKPD